MSEGTWVATTEGYADIDMFGLPVTMSAEIGPRTVFSVRFGDLSFGEILRYLVELARPGFQFDLDPPWDVLDRINLKHLVLQMDATNRRIGFTYDDIGLDLTFMRLDKLAVWYQMSGATGGHDGAQTTKSSVDVGLYGMFVGQDFTREPLSWDVLNQRPPEVPSAGAKTFDLDYAGLGQHVTLKNRDQFTTLTSVIDALMQSYGDVKEAGDPLANLPALVYDQKSNWLVGTRFTVLDTVNLGILFNDPVLYGLHLELRGERAKKLAGLTFDILYRKIADGLGVYHIELTVPSAMRQIELGAASLTLPEIVLDIYTNGNFKVDLGFPYGLDFTRSFTLQFFAGPIPVLGAGGFYFGLLDGQTSTDVPQIINGRFAPVVVFGIGLQVGVGKTFDKGILRAGIVIAVEGALEGVLGFFRPDDPSGPKDSYYRIIGTVAVVGHVYGGVDFGIVSASVDLWARASAQIVLQAYAETTVLLEASVSVRVSVKIVFFRVSFSFGATIRETVELGQASQAPWVAAPGGEARLGRFLPAQHPLLARNRPLAIAAQLAAARRGLTWAPVRVVKTPPTINLYLQPIVTVGQDGDRPPGKPAPDAKLVPYLCAALFIDCRPAGVSAGPELAWFDDVARVLLTWSLHELQALPEARGLNVDVVYRAQLAAIYADLVERNPREPFDVCKVVAFLRENFLFVIRPFPAGGAERAAHADVERTIFPMLPYLTLVTSDDAYSADFSRCSPCSPRYRDAVAAYYAQLKIDANASTGGDGVGVAAPAPRAPDTYSMASFLLSDYVTIILRHVVQAGLDLFDGYTHTAAPSETLPGIAEQFCPGLPDAVARILWANATSTSFYTAGTPLVIAAQRHTVAAGQTLTSLGLDLGLSHSELGTAVKDLTGLLAAGQAMNVAGGTYLLRWTDTLPDLALRFFTTVDALEAANPGFVWAMPGDPDRLPAGRHIALPTVAYTLRAGETLESVATLFGTSVGTLMAANATAPALLAAGTDVAIGLSAQLRQAESLTALAARMEIADPVALPIALCDQPAILAPGVALTYPTGASYVIQWNDTLDTIASRYGLKNAQVILDANPGFDWTPSPDSGQTLPTGKTIALPAVTRLIQRGDTLRSLAAHLGVELKTFVANPAVAISETLLAAGVFVRLLAGSHKVSATDGDTLLAVAQHFGLSAHDLGILNPAAGFGTVVIPDCEVLPLAELTSRLGTAGAFKEPASIVAQFLMSGLRLPDPAAWPPPQARADNATTTLYPLYALTGQQWRVPDTLPASYGFELKLNESDLDCAGGRPSITFTGETPNYGLPITLGPDEIGLIEKFRALVKDGSPLPASLVLTPLPPFAQAPMRFGLAKPIVWQTPEVVAFRAAADVGVPQIHALPDALRRLVDRTPDASPGLRLMADNGRTADGSTSPATPVADAGWATRVTMTLRRVEDPDRPGQFLQFVYEVFSADEEGRALLLALLRYLWSQTGTPDEVRLHLLYAPSQAAGAASGMRSDALDRDQVQLMRANLSTDTRSPGAARPTAQPAAPANIASLAVADSPTFLELLWQASVVNSGGYYLHYRTAGDDPQGLPDSAFDDLGAAHLGVVAFARPGGQPNTIPIRGFHNCVALATTLDSTRTTLYVEPPVQVIQAPPQSATFAAVAKEHGVPAADVVTANATVPHLLPAGIAFAGHDYHVQVGDTPLTIAMALGLDLAALVPLIQGVTLRPGAEVRWSLGWMTRLPALPPGQAGFRALRTDPQPLPDDPDKRRDLELLFNLMGYAVAASTGFNASSEGLPASPATSDPGGESAVPPWEYARVLPVARFAASSGTADPVVPLDTDPYAGVGTDVTIGLDMHDVLGNRCPLPASAAVTSLRYTDALRGPDQWPGVLAGFDLRTGTSGPLLLLRATFDTGRYLAGPAEAFAPRCAQARADLTTHGRIGWQVDRADVTMDCSTSFGLDQFALDRRFYTGFLTQARAWIGTVAAMEGLSHLTATADTLAAIAESQRITVPGLVAANADTPILRVGAELSVPRVMVTIQNDTLGGIVARAADPNLTVARLGELNALVPLQPGIVLDAGGAPHTTGAGDDLTTVATKAHVTVAVVAAANGAVPNIFPAQQPLLVRVSIWPVLEHDTFGMITAATGCVLADLAVLNAGADVLAIGVAIAIPLHVRLGSDTSATRIVQDDDTLASLAGQGGLAVAGLARANQNLAGLLAPGATISCRGTTRQVAAVDTLGTILEVFRAEGMAVLTIAELATANATTPGLLLTGARILVPPRPVELPVQIPVHFPPDQAALPFTVELALRRRANVDPAFAAVPGVAATVTRLKPAVGPLDADGDGTLSLKDLAQRVWDVLRQRLATGSGSAGSAGATDSLMLVQVGDGNFSYSINPRPFYFAPPPLSATLWTPAPGSGGAAARITEGVDLDTWGRRFLADMDRLLSAAYAPGIVAIAPAEYVKLLAAKQQLADTIAETVREVVAHPAGLEPDLDAARDTLRQQLLRALSAAHTTDVIVQHRVSVHAPASAPDVAPRLSGTIVGATYRIPAHATLDRLAGVLSAPLDVFAGLIAGITGILHRGFTVKHDGKTHTITADASLASVAAALTWDVPGLAAAYRGNAGLLQTDADLGLALRTCTISADDTFDSVLLYLAPEVTGPATLAALADRFLALNSATPDLLRPGVGLEVATWIVDPGDTLTSVAAALDVPCDDLAEHNAATADILCAGATITVGGRTTVVPDGATLAAIAGALGCDVATLARAIAGRNDVLAIGGALLRPTPLRGTTKAEEDLAGLAARLGLPARQLVQTQLLAPALLAVGAVVRVLVRQPGFAASSAKIRLVPDDASGPRSSLTFCFDTATNALFSSVGQELRYDIGELEFDVESIPGITGYQRSRWLAFVEPIVDHTMGHVDIPIPLRAYPTAVSMLTQGVRPWTADHETGPALLTRLRTWDYWFRYAYQRAAQDRLETWVDVNVPDAVRAARTPAEELPYALAEFIAVADALAASFAEMPRLLGTTPSDATRARLQADLATMTRHAAAIAQAWKDWAPPLPESRAAVQRVADRATWPAARGGAATTDAAQPRLLEAVRIRSARRLGSGVSRARLGSGAVPTEVGADGVYTHALEGQNVLETQNAWGGVRVTRNDHLLEDRATDPRFIYRMERRTPSKTVPLLERTETLNMADVTQPGLTLVEHLRTFLGALLDVTASSPVTDTRRISVALGCEIPVTGGDGTTIPQALLSPLPVALAPAFDFVPSRDLAPDTGFCHDLAATMTDWLAGAAIDQGSAQWAFQVTVYATPTGAEPSSLPLLTMPDVRLALRDVGTIPKGQ